MFELTGGEPTVYPHIDEFSKFLKQQSPIKEDFDFERYQMLRRAGIIK